jgi:uroporphyrinogen decarboxylase
MIQKKMKNQLSSSELQPKANAATSRQRVLAAVCHETPDRTPMDFGGTMMSECKPEFLAGLRECLGYPLPADRDADGTWVDEAIQRYLGVDLRLVRYAPPMCVMRDLDPAAYDRAMETRAKRMPTAKNEIKTSYIRHDFPLAACTLEDIQKMQAERRQEPPHHLDWIIRTAKDYRAAGYATTYWVSGGFFEQGCAARGYEQFAVDLLADPDIPRALFDLWMPGKLDQVEQIIKPLAPHIDWFCFGDDLGLQNGPFMSPDTYREVVKPYMAEYYGQVHAAAPESFIFHHSCGSVYRLLDDLIEPERLKEKARGRLCLHGGIDLQELLPFGTPAEVRAEALRRMQIMGAGGGYVCAPAHSLPEDVPVANILALFGKS